MTTLQKYTEKLNKEIAKLQKKADGGNFYENFGEKEYRKFKDSVNSEMDLDYSEKSMLCADFSHLTSHINPKS